MSKGPGTATKMENPPRVDPSSRPPDPLLGRVIADRFKITSLIARGGMGKVYRAEQAPLGRLCAIKVLNPNYNGDADLEFHRRFFREASITSKITHPNCVTIFDYGKTDDDVYFMAMEYLEGKTLHQALRENGVIHELRAGRIAAQICRALREAHKLGVIHRDLKPANIFLTRPNTQAPDSSGSIPPASEEDEDFVKVLDFGLVKHLSERPEEQLTQTGLFMGSPKYMAPEQIQGGHVDERTDIYSLGIIMYEMLAGKVPFERASSVNILMAHVGEPPPPMRAVNPNLICSPAFEEIVMACIAKSPSDRFSSMEHLLQAIRRAHGGSMTGQLPALTSGQLMALNSTGQLMALNGSGQLMAVNATGQVMAVNATGQLVALGSTGVVPTPSPSPSLGSSTAGVMTAPSTTLLDTSSAHASSEVEPQPRSWLWLVAGVLVATVLGGGLGMLAFRLTTNQPAASSPRPPAAAPLPPAVAASTEAPAEVAPKPEPKAPTFQLSTDPPGATVFEDAKPICPTTPCEIAFEGDPAKAHRIRITHVGYHSDTRSVTANDPPLEVKLVHVATPSPRAPAKPESAEPSTPDGFKAQPY